MRDDLSVVEYSTDMSWVRAPMLTGFFVGWPSPPSPERHLAALAGSYRVVLARHEQRVVGFVNAISDGVATAFVPWLEVLPDYQRGGIGRELVNRLLAQLDGLYSIDLTCDLPLVGFYRSLGFQELAGMGLRRPTALAHPPVH
ncbi:MAG: GNAT family N-acetyltransferase [Acidothermaceae bacterium]